VCVCGALGWFFEAQRRQADGKCLEDERVCGLEERGSAMSGEVRKSELDAMEKVVERRV
jgi:hypothetical protein